MAIQRYSVSQEPINTLLAWIDSGEIAIPEIQRPFVWRASQVRNLLDSLYQGYPIGYLISWQNHAVRLRDGTTSANKRILIDGQQRITALMAALRGKRVLNKNYESARIQIAFHPVNERFEVLNPAITKDKTWIPDLAKIFGPSLLQLIDDYVHRNPDADRQHISNVLERVRNILHNQVGIIRLAAQLEIETVTEIFVRVNSAGVSLSQADFAMAKIAVNEEYEGTLLRKAIDYFCHLAIAPEALSNIENDNAFAKSEFFAKISWLKSGKDDLYDPSPSDMLRVAFASEFSRGKLQDLVALLSGRNFENRSYEAAIVASSFAGLKKGILHFINETHFKRLTMILRSAGFITSRLVRSQNAVNFAYVIYLHGRKKDLPAAELENLVRRWYVMSILTGRYAGSSETVFDADLQQISNLGLVNYVNAEIQTGLTDDFWNTQLPRDMETSSSISPVWLVYQAAQTKEGDLGFLSRDIKVYDLLSNRSDAHHIYPRNYLKQQGQPRGRHNQIANLAITQSEINIAISDKPPKTYFADLAEQCGGGPAKYGSISDIQDMRDNLHTHCLPEGMLNGKIPDYDTFLGERRKLMALKIKGYFNKL